MGSPGEAGPPGEQGARGEMGERGATGSMGSAGESPQLPGQLALESKGLVGFVRDASGMPVASGAVILVPSSAVAALAKQPLDLGLSPADVKALELDEPLEDLDQRDVRLGDRLVEPVFLEEVLVLRMSHVRQVRVKDERYVALGHN